MRSRYTAYVRRDGAYLMRTCHPSTRPAGLDLDGAIWLGLDVLAVENGGGTDHAGVVEFAATYEEADGSVEVLRETSRFVRHEGAWVYLDAIESGGARDNGDGPSAPVPVINR